MTLAELLDELREHESRGTGLEQVEVHLVGHDVNLALVDVDRRTKSPAGPSIQLIVSDGPILAAEPG